MSAKPLTDLLFVTLLACAPIAASAADQPKGDQEPPQIFYLEFDGKKVPIELDKPFPTEALEGTRSVTLRVEPFRVFRHGGLSFHYPREYTFEADHTTPGLALWTLSGNDCVIMVQRYEGDRDPEAMRQLVVNGLAAKYKDAKLKRGEATWKLKDTTLKGIRLEVELAGSGLHQDLYAFRAGDSSVVLMIQDSLQDDGKPSADRVRADKMLSETLRLPAR
jgi:hypothetical protein